jgi:hypothetical protein
MAEFYIELVIGAFLKAGGGPDQYRAGIERAIDVERAGNSVAACPPQFPRAATDRTSCCPCVPASGAAHGRPFAHDAAPRRRRLAIRRVKIPADGDMDGIEPARELKRALQIGLAEDACPRLQIGIGDATAALFHGQAAARMLIALDEVEEAAAGKEGMDDDRVAPVVEDVGSPRHDEIAVPEVLLDDGCRDGNCGELVPQIMQSGTNSRSRVAAGVVKPPGSSIRSAASSPSRRSMHAARAGMRRSGHPNRHQGSRFALQATWMAANVRLAASHRAMGSPSSERSPKSRISIQAWSWSAATKVGTLRGQRRARASMTAGSGAWRSRP